MIHSSKGFPWSTLLINVLGSFLIGIAAGLFGQDRMSENARLFISVGILGGFTTFSTFSLEGMGLIKQGKVLEAVSYIVLSVALSLSFFVIGEKVLGK